MRLVTYEARGEVRAGVVVGDWVADLERASTEMGLSGEADRAASAASVLPPTLRAVLDGGPELLRVVRAVHDWSRRGLTRNARAWEGAQLVTSQEKVRLWPPITDPQKIICMGRNYPAHAAESGDTAPETPELFAKFGNTLIGDKWPIKLPDVSDQVDYEAELAVIIGRRAYRVAEADALAYVGGYTIFHDVSARDYQAKTSQWLAGKSMDSFAPMGPWIVTPDEVPDPQSLQIQLRVNGELLQDANTATMVHTIRSAIAYISSWMTLEPGDILATGTPSGVGVARIPQRFLQPNDVVVITIEKIGTLTNPVVRQDLLRQEQKLTDRHLTKPSEAP